MDWHTRMEALFMYSSVVDFVTVGLQFNKCHDPWVSFVIVNIITSD